MTNILLLVIVLILLFGSETILGLILYTLRKLGAGVALLVIIGAGVAIYNLLLTQDGSGVEFIREVFNRNY